MKNFTFRNPKPLFDSALFLLLFSISIFPGVNSQSNNSSNPNNDTQYPYSNFNPSIAIIIVVLLAALFFMGFFSFYIRHCTDDNSGGSVRNMLSMHRRANAGPRGIEEAVLETFPTFSYAEVKDHKVGKGALECAVCLNEFEDDETLRLIPQCDHVFHAECIDAWLQGHVTCPVCRADLTPKPGDQSDRVTETTQELPVNNSSPEGNDDVTVQIDPPPVQEVPTEVKREVNRNVSFGNINRPPRGDSVRGGRKNAFGFRSHSTGHSLVQPGENVDRFTLRLPHEIRKEMMNRALLNRTKSFVTGDGSTRRGFKSGFQEGNSRGGRSFRRIDRSDRTARSDRWIFSTATPFFSRALSVRSPKVVAENSEGSASTSKGVKTAVRMPSFKCLEPKSADETGLIQADSVRPPV